MDAGTILTSTVAAAIVSSIISGFYSKHVKQQDYVNEYYKFIIKRRIEAYEQLERLIVSLKVSVFSEDKKAYHFLFSQGNDSSTAYTMVTNTLIGALWISNSAFEKVQELNYLMFNLAHDESPIEFGKRNYETIANLRVDLERILAEDLIELHDVKRFLQQKRVTEKGLREVRLGEKGIKPN